MNRAMFRGLTLLALLALPSIRPAPAAQPLPPGGGSPAQPAASPSPSLSPEEALKKAQVGGKYSGLLAVLNVPGDRETYTDFNDWGLWSGTEWAGFTNLPPGYWVYVAPHWYIWKEQSAAAQPASNGRRSWGPEQAVGPPDTFEAGDIPTAWASLTPDGQEEWLQLDYGEAVLPVAVLVHETFNPGAVTKVRLFRADGEEVDVWSGKDPTPADSARGVSILPLKVDFKTLRVKILLDSAAVPGWNEIDAVGLVDEFGLTHWATSAQASSTYAEQGAQPGSGPGPRVFPLAIGRGQPR